MSVTETFYGFIESTQDALLLFEACRRGILPRVCRRLQEKERKLVRSGSVFIFDERESGIKRWTDGLVWSPSRILGNFLVYRELEKRGPAGKRGNLSSPDRQHTHRGSDPDLQTERDRERSLVGSLTNSERFKRDGLIKKTMSIVVNGVSQHLVSYYAIQDVLARRLVTPTSVPELAGLELSPDLLREQNFRVPLTPTPPGHDAYAHPDPFASPYRPAQQAQPQTPHHAHVLPPSLSHSHSHSHSHHHHHHHSQTSPIAGGQRPLSTSSSSYYKPEAGDDQGGGSAFAPFGASSMYGSSFGDLYSAAAAAGGHPEVKPDTQPGFEYDGYGNGAPTSTSFTYMPSQGNLLGNEPSWNRARQGEEARPRGINGYPMRKGDHAPPAGTATGGEGGWGADGSAGADYSTHGAQPGLSMLPAPSYPQDRHAYGYGASAGLGGGVSAGGGRLNSGSWAMHSSSMPVYPGQPYPPDSH
ncbi:uncharacterized protein VTP21DRAFT_9384 [Calcarisporiella thermophila]|uniref:uncharacterized protein n=1 Tax=Calcarisporiella thermophila TaxID=911321 RepID=UPI0037449E12